MDETPIKTQVIYFQDWSVATCQFLVFFSDRLIPLWVLFIYSCVCVCFESSYKCVMVILTHCSPFRNLVRELFSPWRWKVCDCSSYEGTLLQAMGAVLSTVEANVGQERRHLSCHGLSKLNSKQGWMIITLCSCYMLWHDCAAFF